MKKYVKTKKGLKVKNKEVDNIIVKYLKKICPKRRKE